MNIGIKHQRGNVRHACGFTLIEFVVVIVIIAIMAGLFLSRVSSYQERAEKTAMEQVSGAIQSALLLRYGALITRGASNEKEMRSLANDNPIDWLQQKPSNYGGEFYAPSPKSVAPGHWMFDLKSRELIYVPDHIDNFTSGKDGKNWIRFHIRLGYEPVLGTGSGKELTTTLFEPIEAYHWFN